MIQEYKFKQIQWPNGEIGKGKIICANKQTKPPKISQSRGAVFVNVSHICFHYKCFLFPLCFTKLGQKDVYREQSIMGMKNNHFIFNQIMEPACSNKLSSYFPQQYLAAAPPNVLISIPLSRTQEEQEPK